MGETALSSIESPQAGLSVTDAAELLGVSPNTVRAHLRQGTLAGEKVGGTWVVYLAGVPTQTAPSPSAAPEPLPGSDQTTQISPSLMGMFGRLLLLVLQGLSRQLSALRARVSRS